MKRSYAAAIALFLMLPLVAGAQTVPALRAGDVFTYQRTVEIPKSPPDRMRMVVKVNSVTAAGYSATVTYYPTGKASITHEVRRDEVGWTYVDGADKPHDFLDIDPATLCPQSKDAVVGGHWSCNVPALWHVWPAGKLVVTLAKSSGDELVYHASGVSIPEDKTYVDDDTGKPVATQMRMTWNSVSTYRNSILLDERIKLDGKLHVGNQWLPTTVSVHIVRT